MTPAELREYIRECEANLATHDALPPSSDPETLALRRAARWGWVDMLSDLRAQLAEMREEVN